MVTLRLRSSRIVIYYKESKRRLPKIPTLFIGNSNWNISSFILGA